MNIFKLVAMAAVAFCSTVVYFSIIFGCITVVVLVILNLLGVL